VRTGWGFLKVEFKRSDSAPLYALILVGMMVAVLLLVLVELL
jgi:hypothetical protein